jgi:substrate import-associated zinc metallohydrolase lipoprotein
MKNIKTLFFIVAGVFLTSACSKEKLDTQSVLEEHIISNNALDEYIATNFTKPYNIAIVYKYVNEETNLDYNLSPASYESSIRMTRLLQYLGLEPYDEVTGNKEFIEGTFPKLLNYIGNPAYNNNGTIVLGTAEGGKKVTLYNLNKLEGANTTDVDYLNFWYFHTIHHEFGQILNQLKPFSTSFREISGTDYVNDAWSDAYTDATSIDDGFISAYASKNSNEDFVEIYSFYITLSPSQWEEKLASGDDEGREIINSKLDIVRSYFDESWGIDIDELRDVILTRQANLDSFDQLAID